MKLISNTLGKIVLAGVTAGLTACGGGSISGHPSQSAPKQAPAFRVETNGATQPVVRWDTIASATKYQVYYSTDPAMSKDNVLRAIVTNGPFTIQDIQPGQVVFVALSAFWGDNEGPVSPVLSYKLNRTDVIVSPTGQTRFSVGVNVIGLAAGKSLVLLDKNTNDLAISSIGAFKFSGRLAQGDNYAVTVKTDPTGQHCTITNGAGVVGAQNVTGITVLCADGAVVGPAAPALTLGYAVKQLKFSWAKITGATHYRLMENRDGVSGFTQVGADIPADKTAQQLDIAVHRHNWAKARYLLEACSTVCTASNEVNTNGAVASAIAYFKASNTDSNDRFGAAVALSADGNTLAVAAHLEDGAATTINGTATDNAAADAGAVYVFARKDGAWTQQAYLKAANGAPGNLFGFSLALAADGNTLAVGAVNEDGVAVNSGAAYVFARNAGVWTQQAYLKATNAGLGDAFGVALALAADGNTLAVGAVGEDSSATTINGNKDDNSAQDSGAAYVFSRTGSAWTQQAYIKAANTQAGDVFGISLALSSDGSTLAVGAMGEDSNAIVVNGNKDDNTALDSGAAYVFKSSGVDWSQQAYLKAANSGAGDGFGGAIALAADGNSLAVGATGEDSRGSPDDNASPGSGAAYVFSANGELWSQTAYLKAANSGAGDAFGASLALAADGNTLAVGAIGEAGSDGGINGDPLNDGFADSGAAYVFARNQNAWSQQSYVKAADPSAGDFFGSSVSLSADGNTLAVGAWGGDSNATGTNGNSADYSAPDSGAVYLY